MPLSIHQSILATTLHCAAGLILLSGTAWADTESFQTAGFLKGPDQVSDFKLPTFNANLGSLESINVTLQFYLCPVFVIDNTTGASVGYTNLNLTLPVTADLPGSSADSIVPVSGGIGHGTAKPGIATSFYNRIPTATTESVDSSDFSDWQGALNQKLTFAITAGDPTITGTTAAPGVTFSGRSTEWTKLTVTYTYLSSTAAPEPSGRLLSFIAGAAMLVGIGNRLRKRTTAA